MVAAATGLVADLARARADEAERRRREADLATEMARTLLGGISSGSFYALKKAPARRTLDQDVLTRISLLIGIFKALNILYSERLADAWMTLPNSNPMFRGTTPLQYILRLGQPGMMEVRQMLDARRGGQ